MVGRARALFIEHRYSLANLVEVQAVGGEVQPVLREHVGLRCIAGRGEPAPAVAGADGLSQGLEGVFTARREACTVEGGGVGHMGLRAQQAGEGGGQIAAQAVAVDLDAIHQLCGGYQPQPRRICGRPHILGRSNANRVAELANRLPCGCGNLQPPVDHVDDLLASVACEGQLCIRQKIP